MEDLLKAGLIEVANKEEELKVSRSVGLAKQREGIAAAANQTVTKRPRCSKSLLRSAVCRHGGEFISLNRELESALCCCRL